MDRRVGRMGYCRGTVKMDFWKILSSQPRHLEGSFLLVWIDLIKEISAKPSLVQKLLLVEELWIFLVETLVGTGTGLVGPRLDLSSQAMDLEVSFLLGWIALEEEISAEPSLGS